MTYSKKNHPYQKDGDWGNREEQINQLKPYLR